MAHAATSTHSAKHAQTLPYRIVPGTTFVGLSATVCASFYSQGEDVFYAYKGTDPGGHVNIVELNIDLNVTYTYTDTSNSNPTITCWNNKVMVAFNDSHGGAIHVGDATDAYCPVPSGYCTLAKGNIIPGQSTYGTPAIGANGGTLYVAWRGSNNNNMTVEESVTGATWFDSTIIKSDTTSAEPSLTNYNGNLIIAWAGTDTPAHVNFGTYHDRNTTILNKVTASDTTQSQVGEEAIGISTYNGRLQLAFEQSGQGNQIYTGSWSSSTGYVRNRPLAGAGTLGCPGLAGLNVYFADTAGRINELLMPG